MATAEVKSVSADEAEKKMKELMDRTVSLIEQYASDDRAEKQRAKANVTPRVAQRAKRRRSA